MLITSSCSSQEQTDAQQTTEVIDKEVTKDVSSTIQQLMTYAKAIEHWGYGYTDNDENISKYDSLDIYNAKLKGFLIDIANKQPQILSADLEPLKDSTHLLIRKSTDKKLSIYSWDTENGGTMHFYDFVFQYATGSGSKAFYNETAESEPDPSVFYSDIYQIKTNNNKTYYLTVGNGRYSTKDMSSGITAYTIENDKLIEAPIFVTPKKTYSNISYFFDYFLSSSEGGQLINDIHLSNDNKKLYIPVVISKDEGDAITSKSLVYVFDGEKYVFDKNAQ